MKTSNLCIIPARGGSKRIPRKNIKSFLGKPIIAYSIEIALKSKLFKDVMVSTDDEEIASVSKEYGASVPFLRSKEASNDFATLSDVIEEVKDGYDSNSKKFDYLCCMLPTAPLLSIKSLISGYELLINSKADSVRPIVKFSYPIQRALRLEDNKVSMFDEVYYKVRSQDLVPAYHDAGQFYWMKAELGLKGNNKLGLEIDEIGAQDIDSEQDWAIAEMKYKYMELNHE